MLGSFKAFLVLCSLAGKYGKTTHSIFLKFFTIQGKGNGVGEGHRINWLIMELLRKEYLLPKAKRMGIVPPALRITFK